MLQKYLFYFQYDLLSSISVIITLVPIILIYQRKAYADPSFLLLLIFLLFKLVIDLLMFHYAATRVNNLVLFNVTIIFRYILMSGMFHYKFENKQVTKFIMPLSVGFSFFTLWDIWYCNPDILNLHLHQIVKYSLTVESLLMIFWILLYFKELIGSLKVPNLLTFPFFWICSGLLLYYSSLIFIAPTLHYATQWDVRLDIGLLDRIPYIFDIISITLISLGISLFSARYYARH